MITFTILLIALAILIVTGIIMLLAGGVGFLVTFGDIIICGFIIYLIIRHFVRKKKN